MEIETLKFEPAPKLENELLNSSGISFDLPNLIEQIKHMLTWANGELSSMILLKDPGKQIVLAVLPANTLVKSFQSGDCVTIQVIEGKLRFHTRKESITLERGQVLALHDKIKYNLTTREETSILLTITKNIPDTAVKYSFVL